jgi:superfamily II DNA/RNA helicase
MDSLPGPVAAALAKALGFNTLLPVQDAVIPAALDLFASGASCDMCVSAPTVRGV